MANDDSASAKAQKAKLQEQLQEAKDELTDYEYEHDIDQQQDALDKEQTAFEKSQQERIDALNAYLENREQVIYDSFENVKANTSVVATELTQIAQTHGVNISNVITSAWQQGSNAIASYGSTLSAQSSVFLGNLLTIQNGIYALSAEANNTANMLAYMFSTSANTLLSELQTSYDGISNVNTASQALKDSLINTLERGYNIDSITNGLSSIESSANSAASAVSKLNSALGGSSGSSSGSVTSDSNSSFNSNSNANKKQYVLTYTKYGLTQPLGTYATATEGYAAMNRIYKSDPERFGSAKFTLKKFAKGGIVAKGKNNPFDAIARSLGEDTMIAAKEGESVLTPAQTQNLQLLANKLDSIQSLQPVSFDASKLWTNLLPNIQKTTTDQAININLDKMVEVQGSLDSATMPQVEKAIQKGINSLGAKLNKQIRYGGT